MRAPQKIDASTKFLLDVEHFNLPAPEPEHKFHSHREWRFDFAWPAEKMAVEVEGGISEWRPGRHQRAKGYQDDLDKYNTAALNGWKVFRFSTRDVMTGVAIGFLTAFFAFGDARGTTVLLPGVPEKEMLQVGKTR